MEVSQFDLECDIKIGPECASAIAKGLCENVALQELYLGQRLEEGAFHGPSWERMLDRNQLLIVLDIWRSWCQIIRVACSRLVS
jgi:hypothetical protein